LELTEETYRAYLRKERFMNEIDDWSIQTQLSMDRGRSARVEGDVCAEVGLPARNLRFAPADAGEMAGSNARPQALAVHKHRRAFSCPASTISPVISPV
jgi:hypothetical protein